MTMSAQDEAAEGERMMQMITGYWVTQIVHGAALAGYADHLQKSPMTAEELADLAGLDRSATFRHLRACAALALVSFDGKTFGATPLLDTLRRDHPRSLRGMALAMPAPGHWLSWGRFADVLQTGRCQTVAALGSEIFDYFARNPEEADSFTEAMSNLTADLSGEVARVLDTGGVERVVDIGGAGGALLVPFLKGNPTSKGVVLDLPHVIAGAASVDMASDIRSRIDWVQGDFFTGVPTGTLYLLKHILHDWTDEDCVTILRNCRKAITPGGRIAVIELVLGAVGEPGMAPLMDVNMMVVASGRERSLAEYAELLGTAGFGEIKVTRTATPLAVIEASPVSR
jgi:hypothetical protein